MLFFVLTCKKIRTMFSFLKTLRRAKNTVLSETDSMKKFLIVGLGNVGQDYIQTRHNIGFEVLDQLAKKEDLTFETKKLGDTAVYKLKGRSFLLLKPSTYMNLSGKSVKYWLDKEKIPVENLLVITDDLNLTFGTLRLKTKGSDGGHNGLKDIQNTLQSSKYNRLRFGIGNEFGKGKQVNFVLGKWSDAESQQLTERLDKCVDMIKSFGLSGVSITMNQFNGK